MKNSPTFPRDAAAPGGLRLLLRLGALAVAACTVPTVTPNPVPPPDLLKASDCPPAAAEYRKRLLTMQPETRGAWDPARLATDFEGECRTRLAGRTRRVVLRCWRDATTAAAFLGCNERF